MNTSYRVADRIGSDEDEGRRNTWQLNLPIHLIQPPDQHF